jgi:phosphate transport system substrate-binding protein
LGEKLKRLKIGLVATASLFTLTACDPPIPQSLLVEQAEQIVQCGEAGEVSIYLDPGFADLAYTWNEPLVAACPELSMFPADSAADAQIVASIFPTSCEAIASAPVAYDAAAIVFYLEEAFSINLSGEAIQGIFTGEITNWSDPLIAQSNPEVVFPDLEISVVPNSSALLIEAMERWTQELSGEGSSFSLLREDSEALFSDLIFELPAGGIGLFPLSEATIAGATVANIETPDGILLPDQQSIYAGSTMFSTETNGQIITTKFETQATPLPSPGTSDAALPYKALVPVTLTICNEDSLAVRAVSRFAVRLDAQGLIATSALVGLEEKVRVTSAAVLGTGLPVPEVPEVSE